MVTSYRTIVIGGGPAGLSAALAAVGGGAGEVLVLERRREHDERERRSHGGRRRVVILDEAATIGLATDGIDFTPLREMIVRVPDGRLRFFPNSGAWRVAVEALFGERRLGGLIALGDLEDGLLRAFRSRGGAIRYGVELELTFDQRGVGAIAVGGEALAAQVIIVADGADSSTARPYVRQTYAESDGPPSRFLCLDFDRIDGAVLRPGDVISTFAPQLRVIIFGFVARRGASFNILLPDGAAMSDPGQRRYYLALLKQFVRDLGVTTAPLDDSGSAYDGPIAIGDRLLLGRNVIRIGDAARSSDPIAGAGVNGALADGRAVGQAITGEGGWPAADTAALLATLEGNTAKAVGLSRLVRRRTEFLFTHPNRSIAALEAGLASRGGWRSRADRMRKVS